MHKDINTLKRLTAKKTILDFKAAFKSDKMPVSYETVRERVKLKVAEKTTGLSK